MTTVRPPINAPLEHAPRRKPEGGPPALTQQHRRMIALMVYGSDDQDDLALLPTRRVQKVVDGEVLLADRAVEVGEPLKLAEAAQVAGVRQRNARELIALPIFATALNQEVQLLRDSAKPAAMQRLVELRDRTGAGKAADAKVQLAASLALLGDAAGPRGSSVQVNVGVNVQAGYVIDLRPDDGKPGRPTIEGGAGSIIVSNEEGFE